MQNILTVLESVCVAEDAESRILFILSSHYCYLQLAPLNSIQLNFTTFFLLAYECALKMAANTIAEISLDGKNRLIFNWNRPKLEF